MRRIRWQMPNLRGSSASVPQTFRPGRAFTLKKKFHFTTIPTYMKNKTKTNVWIVIGVIVLIILLLMWLFDAFSMGDTDVNAPLTFLGNYVNFA